MLLVQFGSGNLGRHDRDRSFIGFRGAKISIFHYKTPRQCGTRPVGRHVQLAPAFPRVGWWRGEAIFCHRVRRGSYSGREFLGSITLPPWPPIGCSFFQWFCGSSFSALYTENDNVALFKPDLISAAAALAYFTVADLLLPYNPTVGPAILLFYRRERERCRLLLTPE